MAKLPADRETYLRISKPSSQCLLCGVSFSAGAQQHPSLLELSPKEEVIRRDFCATCYEAKGKAEYFSYWLTKRVNGPAPGERRLARSERNDALWRLFAALHGNDGGASDSAMQIFFLAHLLLRYKVLAYVGRTADGRLEFRHPKLAESFLVQDLAVESIDAAGVKGFVDEQLHAYAEGIDAIA